MSLHGFIDALATGFEAAGAGTMVIGALLGIVLGFFDTPRDGATMYRNYRHRLGRSILLGLEFLVAADILRTVAEIPTLEKVAILGVIVAIRTFLSFSLETELEGRWPWQRAEDPSRGGAATR